MLNDHTIIEGLIKAMTSDEPDQEEMTLERMDKILADLEHHGLAAKKSVWGDDPVWFLTPRGRRLADAALATLKRSAH